MNVQHNLSAATANRNLNTTQKQYQVSTKRLSSGYRINSAADDAAGLTISEKMRWQVRGMKRASDNVEDGISLTQVADGALQEVHSMLQRMVELTVQAANDSNTDEDRDALQREINQIKQEINRISTDTEYNTIKIFKPTSVPKLSQRPTDLMVYWSDDTYPDGSRKGAGILYGGIRYAYEDMKLNYDADGNISAGTYPVDVTGHDGNPLTISLIFDGGNREPAGRYYELVPNEQGVSIDRVLHSWSEIKSNGHSIQEFNNKGGTYTFTHAGMEISFEVEEGEDLVGVIASLEKDELDTYELRSHKTNAPALVTSSFNLSQETVAVTPANSHYFPNSTNSNFGQYSMEFDSAANEIVMRIPSRENQNNGSVEVGRWNLAAIGLPDASWEAGSGINAASSTVIQEGNTPFVLPNTNIYSDITFTVDSECTKNDLIHSIDTDWDIAVEMKNCDMYIKPDSNLSATNPVSVNVSHSASLDTYGTQLNLGLIGGRPQTLTTTKDTSGGSLSFTIQGGQGNPLTFQATHSFQKIQDNIDAFQVVSAANDYARQMQNQLNGYSSSPKELYTYSLSLESPSQDSITITAQEDITGWFTPNMFTRVKNPNTGRWTVTYNNTAANKNTLDAKKDELKKHILEAFENTSLDVTTAGPITAELTPSYESPIENIRYDPGSTDSGRDLNIQSSSRAWDAIPIRLHAMNTGILDVETVDVSSYRSAGKSLNQIYGAIDRVSEIRTEFGVTQNRLENAMSIDDIMAENVQAAESRLRDADMAKESVANALHQILAQSGQSVLAQANQSPQNILNLFS